MEFTELYSCSYHLIAFSPGAHFIINFNENRLILRRADSFEVVRIWPVTLESLPTHLTGLIDTAVASCDSIITNIRWCPNSEYVLASSTKLGFVNIYGIRDEEYFASIVAGAEGLVKAEWTPDGRSVICFSDMGVSQ